MLSDKQFGVPSTTVIKFHSFISKLLLKDQQSKVSRYD